MDATVEEQVSEKKFRTPVDALIFAFHYSMQQQGRPLSDRLSAPSGRTGNGLSGNDGAAQAGMIWRELQDVSPLERAVLVARYAPKSIPCTCANPCCSGYKPNPTWNNAIRDLEQHALTLLAGRLSLYRLRRGLVEKAIGVKRQISELAKECEVDEKTAAAHWKIIKEWISGRPAIHRSAQGGRVKTEFANIDMSDGDESLQAEDGLLSMARKNADNLLSGLSFIGN